MDDKSAYWDNLASEYDDYYKRKWSVFENSFVENQILKLINNNYNILDLGCGTGLGYQMCLNSNKTFRYTGLDLSPNMLKRLSDKFPSANTTLGTMDDLSYFPNESFDLVISTFSAFSFTGNPYNTIVEVFRVLKPNGTLLIASLSRFSLRRLVRIKFKSKERYQTRGSSTKPRAVAFVFTTSQLYKLYEKIGFQSIKIIGYNSLGGFEIFENHTSFWNLNLLISKLFPNLSHELITIAKK